MELRDYQKECINIIEAKTPGSYLCQMPTGCGKTATFTHIPRNGGRVLVLAHREELVRQPARYYDCSVGFEIAKERSRGQDVVIASVQSLVNRLDRFAYDEFDKIITDDYEFTLTDVELTYEEKVLLAKMVWVEAQGESAEGQQAVAEVVLNRLVSEDFPNTLKGVIYSEGQFRSTPKLGDAVPSQAQFEAVEQALEGPYVLPIDVVFFATYPVNKNVWGEIGGHTFCYAWDQG